LFAVFGLGPLKESRLPVNSEWNKIHRPIVQKLWKGADVVLACVISTPAPILPTFLFSTWYAGQMPCARTHFSPAYTSTPRPLSPSHKRDSKGLAIGCLSLAWVYAPTERRDWLAERPSRRWLARSACRGASGRASLMGNHNRRGLQIFFRKVKAELKWNGEVREESHILEKKCETDYVVISSTDLDSYGPEVFFDLGIQRTFTCPWLEIYFVLRISKVHCGGIQSNTMGLFS